MPIDAVNQIDTAQIHTQPKLQHSSPNPPAQMAEDNNNNPKVLIGVGAALALVTLGVLGYKGHLGEGVQKALGGAKKATKEEGPKKTEEKAKEEVKKTFKELYNDAIKEKKESIKNEITGRTHTFEYDQNGKLIKETVSKGDDYAIYENVKIQKQNGDIVEGMKLIEVKRGDTTTVREVKDGVYTKGTHIPIPNNNFIESEIPILSKTKPRKVYDGKLPENLTQEEMPKELSSDVIKALEEKGEKIQIGDNSFEYSYNNEDIICSNKSTGITTWYNKDGQIKFITKNKYNENGNKIETDFYDSQGNIDQFQIFTQDQNNNIILSERFNINRSIQDYSAITQNGHWINFDSTGRIHFDYGTSNSLP